MRYSGDRSAKPSGGIRSTDPFGDRRKVDVYGKGLCCEVDAWGRVAVGEVGDGKRGAAELLCDNDGILERRWDCVSEASDDKEGALFGWPVLNGKVPLRKWWKLSGIKGDLFAPRGARLESSELRGL